MSAAWALEDGALVGVGALVAGELAAGGGLAPADRRGWLAAAKGAWLDLDLALLDVDDGVAMAELTGWLRGLRDAAAAEGARGLRLREAPQMLAHTLYKVGDLRDGRMILVDPRSDEGRWGP